VVVSKIRVFETGATRDSDILKPDYEAYLSPAVLVRYGEYMKKHQTQKDGERREGDNWMKGIPKEQYMKSMWRHFLAFWCLHRGVPFVVTEGEDIPDKQEVLCALMFNVMGYLFEELKKNEEV